MSSTPDPQVRLVTGEIAVLQRQIGQWAAWLERPLLRSSPALNLLWRFRNEALKRDLGGARQRLAAADIQAKRGERYAARGPHAAFADEPAMYDELTAIWRRSSAQLAALCRANGIEYFHFLQPNLNDPGSKPLSGAERALLATSAAPYRTEVEAGYPRLRSAGTKLSADGVAFADLSGLYRAVTESLYVDACCHVSERGYDLVAMAVAGRVAQGTPP